ncbi:AraC family transcriptional regulator, regulatory protein of adaptative response / methylated-DNA-[protein]-cysteine methyltransferase [Mucilaginibacter pineti]|uniref:methylated-DNA--[protein]-cysteine S-methyltransferase n=1 Tax=Mucilaginibacter pineti TaxID=1391627 RepID=A0A1G7J148_9SPHI|nr:methylated-DNA--[protein]-cysteine S-methyltransferase [Mucilaginibacter pineti]SDF18702.1 AraC family transcriptional regulator, regulatory protein of adaptative response / methylated-DNA-[protein]-cysteine methyltransferase [Mucilaginibacter pineti]
MSTQEIINYERIAEAINYIKVNFKSQPNLDEVAEKVNMSPFHFQRLFTDWAGISPKKFLQYLSLEYAKGILKDKQATLFDTAFETGLSGTGRLHDLFINIEGMTPAEYKNGGRELSINYSFAETPFGNIIVASTPKGICYMAFADDMEDALSQLKEQFPNAAYTQVVDMVQQDALHIFKKDWTELPAIKLHLKGSSFQLKVWEALLKIPMGGLCSYADISQKIALPKASRAVGSAIGANPVAFLIPCHRVIKSTGEFGQYHWGPTRKTAMIGWEAALLNQPVSL